MLIKIGDTWIDPSKVCAIETDGGETCIYFINNPDIAFPTNISVDEAAKIINNYLRESKEIVKLLENVMKS